MLKIEFQKVNNLLLNKIKYKKIKLIQYILTNVIKFILFIQKLNLQLKKRKYNYQMKQ